MSQAIPLTPKTSIGELFFCGAINNRTHGGPPRPAELNVPAWWANTVLKN